MSNYTQIVDFSDKDALVTGDPNKRILGSEMDAELGAISTAIASKVDTGDETPAIITTQGDLIIGNSSNVEERLAAGSANQVLVSDGTDITWETRLLTSPVGQALTGLSSHDFLSIPSTAEQITVILSSISTSGTDAVRIQLGTSGGIATTGYAGRVSNAAGSFTVSYSAGFEIDTGAAATDVYHGILRLYHAGGNVWIGDHSMGLFSATADAQHGAGGVALGGVCDRVRVTVTGSDTYDGSSLARIQYQ